MIGQCAGFRSFTGRNGVIWFIYGFLVPYSDRERSQGYCDGLKVVEYWVDKSLDCQSGKAYELFFEPDMSGKARLSYVQERKGGEE